MGPRIISMRASKSTPNSRGRQLEPGHRVTVKQQATALCASIGATMRALEGNREPHWLFARKYSQLQAVQVGIIAST